MTKAIVMLKEKSMMPCSGLSYLEGDSVAAMEMKSR